MKNSNKLLVLFTFLSILLLSIFSCTSDDDTSVSDCSNISCTEEFITIIVTINDQNQNPVVLTSIQVLNLENGEDITPLLSSLELEFAQENGTYPIASDGTFPKNQEVELQFRGFINNQEIISSDYLVATDCCHIDLVSGNTSLIL